MSNINWQAWLKNQPDCKIDKNTVIVALTQSRTQKIQVDISINSVELETTIQKDISDHALPQFLQLISKANRAQRVIRFYLDKRSLKGACWLPTPVLDRDDFLFLLRHLSRESDRLEFVLSAEDQN